MKINVKIFHFIHKIIIKKFKLTGCCLQTVKTFVILHKLLTGVEKNTITTFQQQFKNLKYYRFIYVFKMINTNKNKTQTLQSTKTQSSNLASYFNNEIFTVSLYTSLNKTININTNNLTLIST